LVQWRRLVIAGEGNVGGGSLLFTLAACTQTRVKNWLHPRNYFVRYVGADSVCTQQKNGHFVCSPWYV
jgi:hypothetical protein